MPVSDFRLLISELTVIGQVGVAGWGEVVFPPVPFTHSQTHP